MKNAYDESEKPKKRALPVREKQQSSSLFPNPEQQPDEANERPLTAEAPAE